MSKRCGMPVKKPRKPEFIDLKKALFIINQIESCGTRNFMGSQLIFYIIKFSSLDGCNKLDLT